MTQTTVGHVFMSYSRRDDADMRRIVTYLRGQGINVWVDHEKLNPGTAIWEAKIEKALTGASAVIVILSPDSKNSKWVRREISFAEQYEKPIFPVLVRGDEDTSIPIRLITNQYVDLRQDEELGLKSLCRAISSYLEEVPIHEVKTQAEVQQRAAQHIEKERLAREEVQAQPEPASVPVGRSKPAKSSWRTIGIAGVVVAMLTVCICGAITFLPELLKPTATKAPVVIKTEITMTPALAPVLPPSQEKSPTPVPTPTDEPVLENSLHGMWIGRLLEPQKDGYDFELSVIQDYGSQAFTGTIRFTCPTCIEENYVIDDGFWDGYYFHFRESEGRHFWGTFENGYLVGFAAWHCYDCDHWGTFELEKIQ